MGGMRLGGDPMAVGRARRRLRRRVVVPYCAAEPGRAGLGWAVLTAIQANRQADKLGKYSVVILLS